MRRRRLRTRNRSTIHAGTRASSAVTRSTTESTLPVPVNRHARRGWHRCGATIVGAARRLARLVPHGSGGVGPGAGRRQCQIGAPQGGMRTAFARSRGQPGANDKRARSVHRSRTTGVLLRTEHPDELDIVSTAHSFSASRVRMQPGQASTNPRFSHGRSSKKSVTPSGEVGKLDAC